VLPDVPLQLLRQLALAVLDAAQVVVAGQVARRHAEDERVVLAPLPDQRRLAVAERDPGLLVAEAVVQDGERGDGKCRLGDMT
jgi:hypothetical protein